jgi:hypothetical protein
MPEKSPRFLIDSSINPSIIASIPLIAIALLINPVLITAKNRLLSRFYAKPLKGLAASSITSYLLFLYRLTSILMHSPLLNARSPEVDKPYTGACLVCYFVPQKFLGDLSVLY